MSQCVNLLFQLWLLWDINADQVFPLKTEMAVSIKHMPDFENLVQKRIYPTSLTFLNWLHVDIDYMLKYFGYCGLNKIYYYKGLHLSFFTSFKCGYKKMKNYMDGWHYISIGSADGDPRLTLI